MRETTLSRNLLCFDPNCGQSATHTLSGYHLCPAHMVEALDHGAHLVTRWTGGPATFHGQLLQVRARLFEDRISELVAEAQAREAAASVLVTGDSGNTPLAPSDSPIPEGSSS